jgi:hypothetical protein
MALNHDSAELLQDAALILIEVYDARANGRDAAFNAAAPKPNPAEPEPTRFGLRTPGFGQDCFPQSANLTASRRPKPRVRSPKTLPSCAGLPCKGTNEAAPQADEACCRSCGAASRR